MSRSALFDAEAQKALVKGAHLVRDAVKVTMGPKGKTVVIQQANNKPPVITKDGVSVAVEIQPKDEKVAIGSQLICSVARKALGEAGDGTSSATVLAGAIIDEGIKYTNTNAALSDIRKGINYAAEDVVERLSELSTPITTDEQLVDVATISANGDRKLGQIVAEAYSKVGKDGVVTIEETKERDISLNFTEGMRLDHGYSSPYFAVGFEDATIEYDNAAVMLVDSKLTNMQVALNLLNPFVQAGTPVVIIAEGVDTPVLNLLVKHRLTAGLNIACIDAPGFGQRKTEILRDLGIYLGGEVADDMLGVKLQDMKPEHFGHCEKIIIKKDETIIRGGKGDPEKLEERIAAIKTAMNNTDVQYDKDKLKERLGSLTTGVATIRVGGSSEEEIKELKDRLDDTMWSVKSALEEGFVPGGGRTLAYLADHMPLNKYADELNDDSMIGAKILQKAMRATFSTILENADENPAIYLKELKEAEITDGYNVASMKRVNLVEAGIIDATKVVRSSLQAATSIAGLVLTTNVVITQDPEEKSGINITGMMAPGVM